MTPLAWLQQAGRTALHMATIAAETKQDGHRGGEEEKEILELYCFVLERGQTTKSIIAGPFGKYLPRGGGQGVGTRGHCLRYKSVNPSFETIIFRSENCPVLLRM